MAEPRAVDDIDESYVPQPRERVASVILDGEMVLLDEDTSAMLTLNETATLVWASFDGNRTIRDIVADLSGAYAQCDSVRRDVLKLVRELARQDLLRGPARHKRDSAAQSDPL